MHFSLSLMSTPDSCQQRFLRCHENVFLAPSSPPFAGTSGVDTLGVLFAPSSHIPFPREVRTALSYLLTPSFSLVESVTGLEVAQSRFRLVQYSLGYPVPRGRLESP